MTHETTDPGTADLHLGPRPSKSRWAQLQPRTPVLYGGLPASSYAAEQYRQLAVRTDQHADRRWQSGQVLAVTASEPASGKTLTSLNLSLAYARKGEKRVLLVECDLWRPQLERYLRFDPAIPGICQVLKGEARLEDAIVSVWGAGLDVIRAGIQNEVENLFGDRKVSEILTRLRSRYEIVILDTPPILIASGRSLTRLAHRVLIVVRAGRTKRKGIEEALSGLDREKVVGLVLNDVPRRRLGSPSYSAYSYYGAEGYRAADRQRVQAERVDLPLIYPDLDEPRPRRGLNRSLWRRLLAIGALVAAGALVAFSWMGSESVTESDSPAPSVSAQPRGETAPEPDAVPVVDEVAAAPEAGPAEPEPWHGRATEAVRLRSGPGLDHLIVGVVPPGEQLMVLEEHGEPPASWLRVRAAAGEGWVYAAYVEEASGEPDARDRDHDPPV